MIGKNPLWVATHHPRNAAQYEASCGQAASPLAAKPRALKRCLTNLLDNAIRCGKRASVVVTDGAQLAIRILDEGREFRRKHIRSTLSTKRYP